MKHVGSVLANVAQKPYALCLFDTDVGTLDERPLNPVCPHVGQKLAIKYNG